MPPQSSNNRGELSLESVDKDVGSCFNRVYHCEDDLEELRTAAKEAAKLAVFNARELNQVSSTTKITCFLTGSLKDTVNVAFKAFREEARKAREEKKGKKGDVEMPDAAADQGKGKASASKTPAEAQLTAPPSVCEHPGWPGKFHKCVVTWMQEELKKPMFDAQRGALQMMVTKLEEVPTFWAYKDVKMYPLSCPGDDKDDDEKVKQQAWKANVTLAGGSSSATLFETLTKGCLPFYRRFGPDKKSYAAEFSAKPDCINYDRPLTASVAKFAGVKVHHKQSRPQGEAAEGASSSSTNNARKRPSPERAESGKKNRNAPRRG